MLIKPTERTSLVNLCWVIVLDFQVLADLVPIFLGQTALLKVELFFRLGFSFTARILGWIIDLLCLYSIFLGILLFLIARFA